jgi:M6 family metalloprotease-like protein
MPFDSSKPKFLGACRPGQQPVVGYDQRDRLVYLVCNSGDSKLYPQPGADEIDQLTGKPLVSPITPEKTFFRDNFGLYIYSKGDAGSPTGTITDASALSSVELCKVQQGDPYLQNFSSGFPIKPERMSLVNNPTIQFIPVDFLGFRAKSNPQYDLKDVTDILSQFYASQSTKSLKLDFRVPSSYTNLPKRVEDYKLDADFTSGGFTNEKGELYRAYEAAAIAAIDPIVDFTGVQTVVIAAPPGIKNSQIGVFTAGALTPGFGHKTNEGTIYNVLIRGNDEVRDLDNWTHEFGHMLGLTDIRNTLDKGNQKSDGMGYFDLMANPNLPELLVWNRFLLGILNDDQIRCVTNQVSTTHWLSPVEAGTSKPKGVVIPLSSTTAIVIESRRRLGFDVNMGKESEGALVYRLDTKIRYGLSPLKIIYPARSIDRMQETDSTLRLGESVTSDGWKITVTETGKFGDVVKVEKVG